MLSRATAVGRDTTANRQVGLRSRRAAIKPATAIFCSLIVLVLLAIVFSVPAQAAECTNTWTGSVEGSWRTAGNWSTGKAPTSKDVACIGAGKTVKVTTGTNQAGIVQGEGSIAISGGSLELVEGTSSISSVVQSGGILTGAGTLEIVNTFLWSGGNMEGSGSTALRATATGEFPAGQRQLKQRAFVNHGTFTIVAATRLEMRDGAEITNTGTFVVNSEWQPAISNGGGEAPLIANTGAFEKTKGTGKTEIAVSFENNGEVRPSSGYLSFKGGGSSNSTGEWLASESTSIRFTGGSFAMDESAWSNMVVIEGGSVNAKNLQTPSGSPKVVSGSLSIEGALDVPTFTQAGGFLTGPGTLEVSQSFAWSGGEMVGLGKTVLKSGASGTVTGGSLQLSGRSFANHGMLTISAASRFRVSEGAVVANSGTVVVNSEWEPAISDSGVVPSTFVNTGILKKTAGAGKSEVKVNFENQGEVKAESGYLSFTRGGTFSGKTLAGPGAAVKYMAGFFSFMGASWGGAMTIGGTAIAVGEGLSASGVDLRIEASFGISGSTTLDSLILSNGALTGSGTLEIAKSFLWSGGNMEGSGATVLQAGATGEFSAGQRILRQRTLINHGTFTLASATRLEVRDAAEIRNNGTFIANSEWEPAVWIATANPPSKFVNNGTVKKAVGTGTTWVDILFENHGALEGKLKIPRPITVEKSNQFGKRSNCGDPVECATGNFYESQTDLAIGGLGVGLYLTRTYSAQDAAVTTSPGIFGYGWTSSFGDRLAVEEEGATVTLTQSDGSTIPFTKVGNTYAAPAWSEDELSGSPEASYTLHRADQIQLDFSGTGRLESVVDRNGNETTLAYDEAGCLKTIEDPAGRRITLTYNAGGQVESAKDPMGHVVKYAYESRHLKSVTLPANESARWQFKYDGSHRITTLTDGRGGKTTNEYDASSRVKSQTDPGGHTLTFEYASFHTRITNKATGAVTDQWFTSNNQPYSITRGFGTADATTETFAYNTAGQLVTAIDGNSHKTTYGYDAEGNRTSEKDAEGNETKWTYNGTHDVISMTTPKGETTTIERDGDGKVKSISRPGPEETTQTTTFEHDELGQLESITDPLERTWMFAYNEQGDRIASIDPEGHTRSFEYDESSRLEAIVSPRGNAEGGEAAKYTTTIERDQEGRPRKVIDPLGQAAEYGYDANGNLEEKTNANGHMFKYVYNADDEQIKVIKPNGAIFEAGYDGAGTVTSQTDGNKKITVYVRNALGQPVEVIDPLNRKTIEEFDDAGNLKAVIDAAERKASYVYDKADRLIEVAYSDPATPDVQFEYDANGNVTSMVDGTGESTFDYDELGRLTASENGHADAVGYGYDLAEQLTGILYPNGKSISRAFDQAGRLESITDWLGGTTTFGYDADSNLEQITFPAGTGNVDEYEYDPTGRMTDVTFSKGMETLASLSYVRDKIGQVEDEASNGLPGAEEISYGYDKNERLIETGEGSFEYDAADNLTKAPGATNAYDAASQLKTGTAVSYVYDKLGQRTETAPSSGPTTSYGYDQAGNLISIERPEEGEVPAIEEILSYDATGLLASKAGLVTQHFTWNLSTPQPLLLDDNENSYIYGPNDLPIAQIEEDTPTYLHHDQLGSTRILTDSSGEAVGTFSFSPYGMPEGSTGTATTPMGFAGQYTDSESGLQYLRARFYDPATAQFMTKDPLAAILRTPYGYANQSPLHYVDPSGMACVGVGHSGPISFPTFDPGDCIDDTVAEAGDAAGSALNFGADNISLLAAPLVFLYCVYDPDGCTKAALFGAAGTAGVNGYREFKEPCFEFWSATLQDLLVTLAAALPGGLFEATAGRAGPQLGPIVRRIIQVVLDAPGLGLELVNGARGH